MDQLWLLQLDTTDPRNSVWHTPTPPDGDASAQGQSDDPFPNAPGLLGEILQQPGTRVRRLLFCSDLVLLSNGERAALRRHQTTTWRSSRNRAPRSASSSCRACATPGSSSSATQTWYQTGPMNFGCWYPSLVTLGNGSVFVASGVTKLLKPVYDQPETALLSGTNVEQTETFTPATGAWSTNPPSADHSLPLFPRLHLLPDGNVYYDAGGQTFNPFGQSYDEALWNTTPPTTPPRRRGRSGHPLRDLAERDGPAQHHHGRLPRVVLSVMLPLAPDARALLDGAVPLGGRRAGETPALRLRRVERHQHGDHGGRQREVQFPPHDHPGQPTLVLDGGAAPHGSGHRLQRREPDDVVLPGTSSP